MQPFTWQRSGIRRRLDHFVANNNWSNRFGEVFVKHLPNLKSNHIPILLAFDSMNNRIDGERPF